MIAIASPDTQSAIATPQQQITALLEYAGVAPLSNISWIRVTGSDRVRWLNGMTTNSIQQLKPGEANYNFFLSSQGRIQGDAVALALDNSILLGTAASRVPELIELLDRFIIMDDVELAPHASFGLLVAGPQAAQTLASIGISVDNLAPLQFTAIDDWRDQKVALLYAHSPLVPRFELWTESADGLAQLAQTLIAASAVPAGLEAINHLRLMEGTPLYGIDIRDKELPQETNQTRALHFAKGCYLGQEIVERIRSRGNVHRAFHAFELTGELPTPNTALEADGKAAGELTSAATIPLKSGAIQLALGYIRREALERNLALTFRGGTVLPVDSPYRVI